MKRCGTAIDAVAEPTRPSGTTFSSAPAQVRRFVLFRLLLVPTTASLLPTAELHHRLLTPDLFAMFDHRCSRKGQNKMQLRVGLLQMADCGPRKEDLQAKGEAYCRQAAAMGADIALFPEM
jgi:hypothetical protein